MERSDDRQRQSGEASDLPVSRSCVLMEVVSLACQQTPQCDQPEFDKAVAPTLCPLAGGTKSKGNEV